MRLPPNKVMNNSHPLCEWTSIHSIKIYQIKLWNGIVNHIIFLHETENTLHIKQIKRLNVTSHRHIKRLRKN